MKHSQKARSRFIICAILASLSMLGGVIFLGANITIVDGEEGVTTFIYEHVDYPEHTVQVSTKPGEFKKVCMKNADDSIVARAAGPGPDTPLDFTWLAVYEDSGVYYSSELSAGGKWAIFGNVSKDEEKFQSYMTTRAEKLKEIADTIIRNGHVVGGETFR